MAIAVKDTGERSSLEEPARPLDPTSGAMTALSKTLRPGRLGSRSMSAVRMKCLS